jgi:anaerobic selenocysteine-containing dehydrogenase
MGSCSVAIGWRAGDRYGDVRALIHTRAANAKWLTELSHTNPLWVHPEDATREGLETGQLARLSTKIGHFVLPVYVTEGIRPGVVACSHHVGRWRLDGAVSGDRTYTGVSRHAMAAPGSYARRSGQARTRAMTPTARVAGGPMVASTRTSPSPSSPTP